VTDPGAAPRAAQSASRRTALQRATVIPTRTPSAVQHPTRGAALAENGRVAVAATMLGVDQSTVSRRLHALESALGIRVLAARSSGRVLRCDTVMPPSPGWGHRYPSEPIESQTETHSAPNRPRRRGSPLLRPGCSEHGSLRTPSAQSVRAARRSRTASQPSSDPLRRPRGGRRDPVTWSMASCVAIAPRGTGRRGSTPRRCSRTD